MANNRKEEILFATLELAAERGLGDVSMGMIADRVGIKKPSLYNHFSSKEEIIKKMYQYLREKARLGLGNAAVDYGALFDGKTAFEVLMLMTDNYKKMNHDKYMWLFYKVIYSERSREPIAAGIMAEETERMIIATKQLFYALQVHGLLYFGNPDMSAVTFAMTVHGLLDYETDLEMQKEIPSDKADNRLLHEYLRWFCEENAVSRVKEAGQI